MKIYFPIVFFLVAGCAADMTTMSMGTQFSKQNFSSQCQSRQVHQHISSSHQGEGKLFVQTASYPSVRPNDPGIKRQEHLNYIQAEKGWETFYHPETGIKNDVVIAVIDAGVDIDHEDIKSRLWVNKGEIPDNNIDDDGNGFIDDVHGYNFANNNGNPRPAPYLRRECSQLSAHGTHVSGLIVGELNNGRGGAGVMGNWARLMSLNVFGNFGSGCTLPKHVSVAHAIVYAVDNGANIINISFGGDLGSDPPTVSIERAIAYALHKGVVVVTSAGNSRGQGRELKNQWDAVSWPASYGARYSGMITVGATSVYGNQKCRLSNYSSVFVEIGAPGCDWLESENGIYSSFPGERYGFLGGTSMASPIVAGAAALAYGLIRDRSGRVPSPAEVENILFMGSSQQRHLSESFKDGRVIDLSVLADVINTYYPPSYRDLSYHSMDFNDGC